MTARKRLDLLARQKAEIKAPAPLAEQVLPSPDEAVLITHPEHVRVHGELEALRWLKDR